MGDTPEQQAMKDYLAIQGMRKQGQVDPEAVKRKILEDNMRSVGSQTNAFSELYHLGRVNAPAAIQMGATAAGGALGGLTSPVTGPVGPAAGAMLGSGAGTALNQAIGLEPPDTGAIIGSTVLPGMTAAASPVIGGAIKLGTKLLPGRAATMHQIAREALDSVGNAFGSKTPSDQLYAAVQKLDPQIALPGFTRAANTILKKEEIAAGSALKFPGVAGTATELTERVTPVTKSVPTGILNAQGNPITRNVTTGSDTMPFQDIRENLARIGAKIRETRISGSTEHGAWKLLRKSLMDDLEAAAAQGNEAQPAVQALKAANAAFRHEAAQEELQAIFTQGGMVAREDIGPGFLQVNLNKIADLVRKGKHADDIRDTLRPEEYALLKSEISRLAKQTPNLPPPRGQFAGSAIMGARIVGGGAIGYLGGDLLGLDPNRSAAAGTAFGAFGANAIARLLMSDNGRRTLQFIMQSSSGNVLSPQAMQLIGAAASREPNINAGATNLTEYAAGQLAK